MIEPLDDYPIVLGMGPAGLFLARQLYRMGCSVGAIARPGDVGIPTNVVTKGALKIATSLEDVVAALDSFMVLKPGRRLRLLLASDQYLTLLLQLDDSQLRLFGMEQNEIDSFRLVNDKTVMEKTLGDLSLTPKMFELNDVPSGAYPCVVKWNEKRISEHSSALPKVAIVDGQAELSSLLLKLEREGFSLSDVVAQKYIPGNNAFQYSFGGYYQRGNLMAGICVNQVRQYPQGISSCVVESREVEARRVEEVARLVAGTLSFSGFLEVECKVDQKSGRPFVLDVNPRPWGWISILGAKYPNFYQVLLGNCPCSVDSPIVWRSFPRNLLAGRNKQNIRPSCCGYMRCTDIVDWADMRPFFGLGLTAARKMVKR